MQYCSQCGQQLPDEARFCKKCGAENEVVAVARETEIPAAPTPGDPVKNQGKGLPVVRTRSILTGLVLALLLVAGGFWGWRSLSSEARVQQKLDLAVKYLSENKFEEAILQYNEVLKIDNKNLIAYKGLGKTYTIQGNYTEAEKTYQAGLDLVDDKKQLKLSMAGLYIDQGKNDLAEKTYTELIAGDKTFILAYEGLARLLITRSKQDEAVSLLRQCLEANSTNERSYSFLAGVYLQKGDHNQALDLIARSLKTNPNQYSAYSLLENLFNKDWNKIIEYSSTLMAQDETAGRVLRIYGYYHAGQYEKAIKEYLALADKGQRSDKADAMTALAYLKTNDSRSADKLIKKVDLKGAGNPSLYADVARYYLEQGDLKQARRVAIEGIGIDDTCLENYLVLIELARRENGSDTYYSYLLLTSSTSSALVLEKELKEHGVEVKFLSSEETTFEPTEENTAEISEQDNTSSSTQQKETEQEDRNNQQNTAKNEDENKKTEAVNYPPVTTVISLSENGKGQLSKSNVTLHLGQELIIKCGSGCNYIKLMTSDVISFDLFSWRTAGEYTGPSSAEQYILKATRLGTAYIDVWPNADGSYSAALTVNIIN